MVHTIDDISKLSVSNGNLCYEGKKIGKWWGKTLYHLKDGKLEHQTFSPIGLILHHVFGYKKAFSTNALKDWLISKNVLQSTNDTDTLNKKIILLSVQRFQQNIKKTFTELCLHGWGESQRLKIKRSLSFLKRNN